METERLKRRIRYLLILFIAALVASGITAIPLTWEAELLDRLFGKGTVIGSIVPAISQWVSFINRGLQTVDREYPFISYGTDWLAFAHIVIAMAFVGPLRDPVRNLWVVEFGMITCALIIPTALIFGTLRGIPLFWQIIDCSFGIFGILPLFLVRSYIKRLAVLESGAQTVGLTGLVQAKA